jgi:lysophospholipase L1-like esterase
VTSRQTRGNLLALAIGATIALVAGEVLLRAVVVLPLRRKLPEVRYETHPVRRFTLLAGQNGYSYGAPAAVDQRGFRSNGAGQVTNAAATVFALGDSFTFGMGVRDEETWPARLERLLQPRASAPVTVVNGGTISYGVFQELDLLRAKGLATRPNVVIHALYWNDFMNPEPPAPGSASVVTGEGYLTWDGFDRRPSLLARGASWVSSRSALLFSMRQAGRQIANRRGDAGYGRRYASFVENGLTHDEWVPLADFYKNLKALAAEHGFAPMVVIMPVDDIVAKPHAEAHAYPAAARRLLQDLEIPYVDGFALWARRGYGREHFLPQGSDAHLNAKGYQVIAEALAGEMMGNPEIAKQLK